MTMETAFSRPVELSTSRLMLRQMSLSDAEAVFILKSDPEVTRYYGQEPHRSIEETRGWIQRSLDGHECHESITWVIILKDEQAVIGECCLWNFDHEHLCAEVGYEIVPKHWNKGLMTEALSAILNFGFVELGLHRIEAVPYTMNHVSHCLLLKLGFRHEGILRQRHRFQDQYLDQSYFGLLDGEWREGSNRN